MVGAQDPARPPRLEGPGDGRSLLDVQADHLVLRDLHLGPTPRGVHGIVLSGASHVLVLGCELADVGGLSIVETMSARDVVLRDNRVRRARATALYFGCHGGECTIAGLVVEGNVIDGVEAPRGEIGYGLQVKLDSWAVVRGNLIRDTKGPGIMLYGARPPGPPCLVERNIVLGSRRSAGIVVGGGPAVVRGNVVAGHARAGIALEDYRRRGLLRGIEVTGNLVYGNRGGGITAPARGPLEAVLGGNVVRVGRGADALPRPRPGLRLGPA